MPRIVPLVVGSLTLSERVDFLRAMRQAQPPAVFEQGTARRSKAALPEPAWAELTSRIPELAAA